ncbi:MAG: D-glycerate dehydrogenase [Parcubacteria group bacterium]|nr:D-glycerate dehydrogenase [Parcubacteria group bacterium]
MSKPLVYISRKLSKEGLDELYRHCRVIMNQKRTPPSRAEFLRNTSTAEAIITVLTERVDDEVFRTSPKLKIVANYAVGYDNIDLKSAARHCVPISNTPGNLAGAVAEHAMALILNVAKRVLEGDRYLRAGNYTAWDPLLLVGNDVRGRVLGIVGTGRIGGALAAIATRGFGMRVIYYDVIRNKDIEQEFGAKKVGLRELLKSADYVSLHVPLLPSTRHLIGNKELASMKPTAYLINTSRGPVVDEKALVSAIKAKKIAGAGLDVFENEPKLTPGLVGLQNVVLTPHIASATVAARREMGEIAAQNVLDVLIRGKRPRNEVK